ANLDAEAFADRRRAEEEIKGLGARAIPTIRRAAAETSSLETRKRIEALLGDLTLLEDPLRQLSNLSPEALREYRALSALERSGRAEARQLLKELAGGAPGSVQTYEAAAALSRLTARDATPNPRR